MSIKNFKGLLVLNWKDKSIRLIKGKSKQEYKPYEVPIRLNVDLEIPETKEHKVEGKITVPEVKVQEMLLESI